MSYICILLYIDINDITIDRHDILIYHIIYIIYIYISYHIYHKYLYIIYHISISRYRYRLAAQKAYTTIYLYIIYNHISMYRIISYHIYHISIYHIYHISILYISIYNLHIYMHLMI